MKYKTKVIVTGCTGMIISLFLLIGSIIGRQQLTEIPRPPQGTDSVTEHLQVQIGEEKESIDVTVAALPFDEKEQQAQIEKVADQLEEVFLGSNTSLNHIIRDVSMPTQLADSEVQIQWYLDSWEYMEPDGTVKNEGITEKVPIQVQAVLSFGEENVVWTREIKICPPEDPDMKMMTRMLQYQIQEQQNQKKESVLLPKTVGTRTVTWYPQQDHRWVWTTILTIAAVCGLWVGHRKDKELEWQKYERNMQLSYPDIVNRLSLYMGAGISIRRAWERIVQGYEQKCMAQGVTDPAYEQMKITYRQMQSGVAETAAYEQFGVKCRLPSYLKLGTLLSQNLRLGTNNLAGMLKSEARDAFEDRKALARKMGEECESKLLLPMLLMLLSILLMIMYPAIVSFAG